MSARSRVARFLKAYWPIGEAIGKYDGHPLFAGDLEKLLIDSKDCKRRGKTIRQLNGRVLDLEAQIEKDAERILQLEQETAPELDTEPLEGSAIGNQDGVLVLEDLLNRTDSTQDVTLPRQIAWQLLRRAKDRAASVKKTDRLLEDKQELDNWVTAVWHALPSEFCKAGETPGQAVQRVVAELETARKTIEQWNGAEERWTAKREAYEAEIGKLRADSDKLTEAWLAVPVMDRNTGGLAASIHAMADLHKGDIARVRELEAERRGIEALIPNGYIGSTAQKIQTWVDNYVKRIEQLNETVGRARDESQRLRLQLRDAQGQVGMEVNGNGPDGASNLARWVQAYRATQPGGHGRLHSINADDRPRHLDVVDIEATLRQLNEARALAHERGEELKTGVTGMLAEMQRKVDDIAVKVGVRQQ